MFSPHFYTCICKSTVWKCVKEKKWNLFAETFVFEKIEFKNLSIFFSRVESPSIQLTWDTLYVYICVRVCVKHVLSQRERRWKKEKERKKERENPHLDALVPRNKFPKNFLLEYPRLLIFPFPVFLRNVVEIYNAKNSQLEGRGEVAGMRGDVGPEVAGILRIASGRARGSSRKRQVRAVAMSRYGGWLEQRHNTFLGTVPALPGTTGSIQFASPPRNIDLVRRKSPVEIEEAKELVETKPDETEPRGEEEEEEEEEKNAPHFCSNL